MLEKKEIEDFLVRFAGAMTGGLEDAALEAYWVANPASHGKFPYTALHPLLPPNDDVTVGLLSIPPWVIGALMEEDAKKRGDIKAAETGKTLKKFGEGDVIYAANMLLDRTLIRAAPLGRRVAAPSGAGTPSPRTDVGHRILKL